MSATINTAFVNQYQDNIELLMQQKGSKLLKAVRIEMQNGEYDYYDQMSKQTSLTESPTRNAATTYQDSPYVRRRVGLTPYKYAELIDKSDKVKMLIDPANTIAKNVAFLFGRTKDSVILTAASGTAYTGKTGSTSTSFSASMVIPATNVSGTTNYEYAGSTSTMNVEKILGANYLLDYNDVDEDDRWLICHPIHKNALLQIEKVTSGDYASKALMTGQVDSFAGLNIIYTTLCSATVSYVWHRSAVLLAIGTDDLGFRARIEENMDRWYSTQVTNWMDIGATRMDENAIVQILHA